VTRTSRAGTSRQKKNRASGARQKHAVSIRKEGRRSGARTSGSRRAQNHVPQKPNHNVLSPEEVQAWWAQTRLFKGDSRAFGLTREDFKPAWSRVGGTDEARARWLLDFAARDLGARSGADWLDLRWDVFGFLYPPSGAPPPFSSGDTPGEPSCSEDQVRTMHSWLRSGLERLTSGKGDSWAVQIATTPRLMMLGGHLVTLPDFDSDGPGEYAESFRLQVYEVLGRQAPCFRVCARCRRPFLARKRQAYCTKKCSQDVRTAKYRASHREKVNALRRNAYSKKRLHGAEGENPATSNLLGTDKTRPRLRLDASSESAPSPELSPPGQDSVEPAV